MVERSAGNGFFWFMKLDLITVGEFYNDFIFYRLRRLPRLGEELRARCFARSVGGGAAITAVAAQRLGLRVGVVTVAGREDELAPLRSEGIDTSRCVLDPRQRSPITVAVSTRRDRYFLTHEGPNTEFERLQRWERLEPYLARTRHVHFALPPRRLHVVSRLMRRLHTAGVSSSVDFGWKPELVAARGFWDWLGSATIFFPNLPEAQALTGEKTAARVLAALAERVPLPVLKLGPRGALAWDKGRVVRVSAPRVRKVVDSTGAGDAFNGGFLYGFVRGRPLEECLRWGNFCGARSVTAPGGVAALPRKIPLKGLAQ